MSLFTQPWVVRLGWTLLHFLWQGTLIAIVFTLVRAVLARLLSAHVRYLMACGTLVAMTVAPILTYLALGRFGVQTGSDTLWQMIPIIPNQDWQRALPWLVAAWLGGVIVFSARLLGGWRLASRIRSAALQSCAVRPVPAEWRQTLEGLIHRMGAWRPVRLLISSLVEAPTVIGWLRPVILMPVGALTGLPPEHVAALLAHELAHIRRHDYLANILQSVAEAVLFYHPAVWWVSDQIRAERELCCDDLAVAACGGDVLTYARALAEVESFRPAHAGTVLAANGGSLASRIRRLIGQPPSASQSLPGPGAVSSLALLWLVGIGAVTMHGAALGPAYGSTPLPSPPSVVLPAPALPAIALPPTLPQPSRPPVLSALLFDPFFAPPQAIAPAPAPAASSSISGHITNSVTGAGIAGAEVSAWISDRGHAPETVTDDTGAFRIAGIPDGPYTVMSMKDGFFPAQSSFDTPIRVFGDTRFDLKMTPNATLRGRVLDPEGKPAAGVSVKFGLPSVPVSVTNEKGEFVFEDVPPIGDFTLSATPTPQPDVKGEEKIVTTYYPSVADSTQAAPINVQGVDLSGYEIRLQTAPARRIRGVVIDVDGKPAPDAEVSIFKLGPEMGSGRAGGIRNGTVFSVLSPKEVAAAEPVETGDDGSFAFPPVIEGDWRVRAVLGREGFSPRSGGVDVTVSSSDIEDLEIHLTQPFEVEVTADWGDPPPATPPPTQVTLASLEGVPDLEQTGQPQRFKISAGRHFIGPGGSTPGYYAAAAMLGNRDVLGQVVELSGPATLKMIYKTDGGSVRGTVEHGAGATVVLMADATPFARLGFTARCDADGEFVIRDVPPGGYTVVAGQGFFFGLSPKLLNLLAASGERVQVDAQATVSLDLQFTQQEDREGIEEIMNDRIVRKLSMLLAGAGMLAVVALKAQTADAPEWQTAAGGKMAFDVASVKQAPPSLATAPSFPLDSGDAFTPTGGRFVANFPLDVFIRFAYKYSPAPDQRQAMLVHLPGWVSTDRFTIEAKAAGNPTKDQFRLMMQLLLADRFKVAVHFETRQGPVLALALVKPSKLGPKLHPHAEGPPCDAPAGGGDVFPATCGSYGLGLAPDRMHLRTGSRNATMAYLAQSLSASGAVPLPVVDQTGLSGGFDLTVEYSPAPGDPFLAIYARSGVELDPQGPLFLDALREQLGLKLDSTKGPIQVLVIDHVERPSEN